MKTCTFVALSITFFGIACAHTTLYYEDVQGWESFNYPGRFIRHRNYLGELTQRTTELDRKDASFKIVHGLADSTGVSFESINFPGYYLRHQNFRLKLHKHDGSDLFKKDATFFVTVGLKNVGFSFQSLNYPDRFIRHRNFNLWVETGNTDLFHADATFFARAA